ncbi:oxidoreductase [Verticiella sediminum]|uniref:Oxidoreductase n=1 Tax=Verticiella sediminum TaxID=1247510 RepID=A0A556ACG8_9BURK|nr:PDR/VanB family oxidoreductase [Verticiella sediminum]TSH90586.1 oxidoreductase [Verticiella sediminum]
MTIPETLSLRLSAIRYAADGINLYEFRTLDGARLPGFEPGAHVDLHLPNGMVRQYSLAEGHGDGRAYVVGVKLDPDSRGGSKYMHEQLKVGTVMPVGLPRNHFPLEAGAGRSVFVAGGIGITPIHCMIRALAGAGQPWELHYAVRRRAEAAFLAELADAPGGRLVLHVDEECDGAFLDVARVVADAGRDAHLYCCGPGPMLEAFVRATQGLPAEHVHYEYFSADVVPDKTGGFTVELARTQRAVYVPQGKTIAEALRDEGVDIMVSCEQGVCGACETRVLEGDIEHRDLILTEQEKAAGKLMMICVSSCSGDRLVLDL